MESRLVCLAPEGAKRVKCGLKTIVLLSTELYTTLRLSMNFSERPKTTLEASKSCQLVDDRQLKLQASD